MSSIAESLRDNLEAQGEYVVRANADSGWFAIFPETWKERTDQASRLGRGGPNLVVYRTKSSHKRDHYVIPNSILRDLLVESTLTHSDVNGTTRWNLTLKRGQLHVSHSNASIDVAGFHGLPLIIEEMSTLTLPDELPEAIPYREGMAQQIVVNRYERDPRARAACLRFHGAICHVCRMDFATTYGPHMAGFIHVHHLTPLAIVGADYVVEPIDDLRPVCPNCHAAIHCQEPPYTIDEVRSLMNQETKSAEPGFESDPPNTRALES